MKMAFFVGIFLAAPYLLYQIWAFVAPGLYSHEKAYAFPFIVMGPLFFIGGAAFGHYLLFPTTFRFLVQFGGEDMQFLPKVDEYYSFYSWFLLGLGLVFQLPVIIFVLVAHRARHARLPDGAVKYAVLASFVIAAIITPTPDVVAQTLLAVPMLGAVPAGDRGGVGLRARPRKAPVSEEA